MPERRRRKSAPSTRTKTRPRKRPPKKAAPRNAAPVEANQDWKPVAYRIIFGSDTPAGRAFDVVLLIVILTSVGVVMLESVPEISEKHSRLLHILEWIFTGLFTIEYIVRLMVVPNKLRYARSFFGVIDLIAVIPTYLTLILPGTQYFIVIRVLRMLRIFRIFKLVRYLNEADVLMAALRASRRKITVFLWAVLSLVVVVGAMMYLIEGESHGFRSIPDSVYWAVVTLTTVGYGDIVPQTVVGRILASFVMIMGYGIIAVPTGIVSVELAQVSRNMVRKRVRECSSCGSKGHDEDAHYCNHCGDRL